MFDTVHDGAAGVLDGIEVVEVCSAIAGPFAGKLLGDHGAHVTKVEPLWGDIYRGRPLWYDTHGRDDVSYRFLEYNTGKDSIAIDLKSEAGQDIMWRLLEEADIFIENLRAGTMERLGFGWDALHARYPELIYCSVTGYGEDGPYADWPAYDPVIQCVSSWVDLITRGDRPEIMNIWAIDHVTAMYAVIGALMAVIERSRTGEGKQIEVAMLDAAVSLLGHSLAQYSGVAADDDLAWRPRPALEPQGVFGVDDGYLGVAVLPDDWSAFCEAIDRAEYADDDHQFGTLIGRVDNADALHDALNHAFEGRTKQEWLDHLTDRVPNIVCAPVNRFRDLPDDPQIHQRDVLLERDHPLLGEYVIPRPTIRFDGDPATVADAPGLGEQTDTILRALGYSSEEITRLADNGIIRE